jgi:hypothetical protein
MHLQLADVSTHVTELIEQRLKRPAVERPPIGDQLG